MTLRFDKKVVVITGAGLGLGRAYALAFASRGASVVVNDYNRTSADSVVKEIISAGGIAVANYDNVIDQGERIFDTALSQYGHIDVLICNAGSVPDISFTRMTLKDFQGMIDVHVMGTYSVIKAAWKYMREQGYGRIIMTSSPSGLYGQHGHTHYGTAKAALIGFAKCLAQEGQSKNITVNVVAPIAGTRLTTKVFTPDAFQRFKPEYVAPVVLYLSHESTLETGNVYEVGGGFIGKLRWQRSYGHAFSVSSGMTPEMVRDEWDKISDFTYEQPSYPTSMRDTTTFFLSKI